MKYAVTGRLTGFHKNTVRDVLIGKRKHAKVGRPPKLTPRNKRIIKQIAKGKRYSSPTQIGKEAKVGIKKRKVRRRPLLRQHHKEKRIEFARDCIIKKVDFDSVVFSDEKKFKLNGPDGYQYYWFAIDESNDFVRYSADYHRKKGVMVWLCMSSKGILCVQRLKGSINQDTYTDIVTNDPLAMMHGAHGTDFIFQQDNAPAHKAKNTIKALQSTGLVIMDWPTVSPDLNPVENIWALIVRRLYATKYRFHDEEALWNATIRVTNEITVQEVQKYTGSMTNRLLNVIEKKGLYSQ
ncbi:MAG: putative Transposable element Tc3 transposase [Streblomastix strix]|uniref:Putative Transposable element Tc3 transposase n=1 Tax=Streblomastix strix TaxID=222440 RepID=A0A5J4WMG7_9EUKA|nr:MAG: putative Transposable element Tc3 transposase [Streblomastix strix]